ncbi:MAG: hypothetical protein WC785_09125 [Tatlockia sp.]|jgi:opacity protein-like surface antigen
MIIKKLLFVLVSSLLATQAFASRANSDYGNGGRSVVFTLSMGPAWARPGETQSTTNLSVFGVDWNTYAPLPVSRALKFSKTAKGTKALYTGELFVGLVGNINSVVSGQLGLALAGNSSVKLKGTIWTDTNPYLRNFNYSYRVISKRLSVKGKALYEVNPYDIFPYISGSVGVALNNSSGFTITPYIPVTSPLLDPGPIYSARNATAVAWTVGTGLEAALDDGWRVGLGYEFADWGASSLGPSIGQLVGRGLRLSSLRAHEFAISLSYIS